MNIGHTDHVSEFQLYYFTEYTMAGYPPYGNMSQYGDPSGTSGNGDSYLGMQGISRHQFMSMLPHPMQCPQFLALLNNRRGPAGPAGPALGPMGTPLLDQRMGQPMLPPIRPSPMRPSPMMGQQMGAGMMDPSMMGPGMMNPGMLNPGMMGPGMMGPGMMNPGMMGQQAMDPMMQQLMMQHMMGGGMGGGGM